MNKLDIQNRIIYLRKGKGMTQAETAKVFNVSPQAVSKWENGDCLPDIEILTSMAEFYGISLDELINGKNSLSDNTDSVQLSSKEETVNYKINSGKRSIVIIVMNILLTILFLYVSFSSVYINDFSTTPVSMFMFESAHFSTVYHEVSSVSFYEIIFSGYTRIGNVILFINLLFLFLGLAFTIIKETSRKNRVLYHQIKMLCYTSFFIVYSLDQFIIMDLENFDMSTTGMIILSTVIFFYNIIADKEMHEYYRLFPAKKINYIKCILIIIFGITSVIGITCFIYQIDIKETEMNRYAVFDFVITLGLLTAELTASLLNRVNKVSKIILYILLGIDAVASLYVPFHYDTINSFYAAIGIETGIIGMIIVKIICDTGIKKHTENK